MLWCGYTARSFIASFQERVGKDKATKACDGAIIFRALTGKATPPA